MWISTYTPALKGTPLKWPAEGEIWFENSQAAFTNTVSLCCYKTLNRPDLVLFRLDMFLLSLSHMNNIITVLCLFNRLTHLRALSYFRDNHIDKWEWISLSYKYCWWGSAVGCSRHCINRSWGWCLILIWISSWWPAGATSEDWEILVDKCVEDRCCTRRGHSNGMANSKDDKPCRLGLNNKNNIFTKIS